jgi:predicted nucleic-acid-binding Zn-ribbon protein
MSECIIIKCKNEYCDNKILHTTHILDIHKEVFMNWTCNKCREEREFYLNHKDDYHPDS